MICLGPNTRLPPSDHDSGLDHLRCDHLPPNTSLGALQDQRRGLLPGQHAQVRNMRHIAHVLLDTEREELGEHDGGTHFAKGKKIWGIIVL